MPPKKGVTPAKLLLGRPSNNLKIGVVGLPNVGQVPAENYPFCTIEPTESRVIVHDQRFDYLCELYKPASKVNAYLNVIDIAGLVKNASKGDGLGNAFLSHIKGVDAIFHVSRAFSDEEIVHVEGEINPQRDLVIIRNELMLKDEEFLTKHIEASSKNSQRSSSGTLADKQKKEELVEVINKLQLITAKPVIYLVNVSEADYLRKKNKYLVSIKQWIDSNNKGDLMIPMCASLEHEYSIIKDNIEERTKFEKDKMFTSVLPKIITSGYSSLQLIYFFTCGEDEVRAWTIRKNTKAPQAAGTIHTDFERGFIMAEVMAYQDLYELKSEASVKANGKYLQKGKDYIVNDGDIILFKFNVTAPKKK